MKNKLNFKIISIILALITWEVFAHILNKPIIVPSIENVIISIKDLFTNKVFYINYSFTIFRIIETFFIDLIIALTLGTLAYLYPKLEILIQPWESVFRSVPTMALIIASLIWFSSDYTPLFVSSAIIIPIMYRSVVNALLDMDKEILEMIELYKVQKLRKIFKVYMPTIIPEIKTASRNSIGLLFKVMITAEVLSQPKYGIGAQFQIARAVLDTPMVFAISIVVIATAYLLEGLSDFLYKRGNNGYYL